jgi:HK97 family phage major capsid protein
MEKEIAQVREQIRSTEQAAAAERSKAEALVADMRSSGADLTTPENFEKVDVAFRASDEARDRVASLRSQELRLMQIVGEKTIDAPTTLEQKRARSLAQMIHETEGYQAVQRSGALSQQSARIGVVNLGEVATRDAALDILRLRTTVDNTSGSGGGLIWSDRKEDLVVPVPLRRVRLLDVITVGTTDSDTVEWAEETTHTDAAAETAYGTNSPESAYGWTKRTTTVKPFTHFVPATKGSLADGGQLNTLLRGNLTKGINLRVETQATSGNGTGDNISGIYTQIAAGANLVQALSTDSRHDAVHKAITKIRLALFDDPQFIGIHPTDYESYLLEKDANGNYLNGGKDLENPTMWGLTPIVSPVFTQGSPLIADFSYATLWVRSGLEISMSDSHNDFFIKRLIAIMAEIRGAFAVTQTKAFCKVTGF